MDEELEIAQWMLDNGYILDAELFRVAAELKKARERNARLQNTGEQDE